MRNRGTRATLLTDLSRKHEYPIRPPSIRFVSTETFYLNRYAAIQDTLGDDLKNREPTSGAATKKSIKSYIATFRDHDISDVSF